ncbi:hypothetical protein BLNAU_21926 [Blattamonas nauphoetae]|uniref:Uncharacterized protein n=1 Tax=Blattamonas nauphoetae TaxID=2049346 RepID=A0ABQ9WV27_9EUKA|nr:hypothetical protein BLNAU_21926 [Blattamonas nauphoetae]
MEEIVVVLFEEMRLVDNLSRTIKELNESITSELLTITILKKAIVTSAIFLSRVALFVAEGPRQFQKCKSVEPVAVVVAPNRNGDTCLSGRHSNFKGQLDLIHTAKRHLKDDDRLNLLVFCGHYEEHDRDAKDAAKTRFESAAVNEVLPPNSINSVLLFLHLERLQPPNGRHYPTASDVADGIGTL